ncbi:MAG: glutathione S-transferase family protein [Halieaceae bacterium]|jgi:ganglioside-induced differentiation-associated protein 1|nr:glutathione S-transferase family protein [Halieaceae bacterium]
MILAGIALTLCALWYFENKRRRTHSVQAGLQGDTELPHEQEFELYHNALSLCSMKSRLCLAELEIPYKSHPVDLIETGCYENIRSPFLRVNPAGTVPVLVHNGHPIYESHEQIRYAAEHVPVSSPTLVPHSPLLREEMEYWIDRSSIIGDPINHESESAGNAVPGQTFPLFITMIERISFWKILEGLLFHFDKRRPLMFLAFKLLGLNVLRKSRPLSAIFTQSRAQMHNHFDALEAKLQQTGGPWILGDTFSLADVSWLAIYERLRQLNALHVFAGREERPACAQYWDNLEMRPSYQEAIRAHSHPIVVHGTQRLCDAKAGSPALRELLEG